MKMIDLGGWGQGGPRAEQGNLRTQRTQEEGLALRARLTKSQRQGKTDHFGQGEKSEERAAGH